MTRCSDILLGVTNSQQQRMDGDRNPEEGVFEGNLKLKAAVSLSCADVRYTKCIWQGCPNHLPYLVRAVSYMALSGRKQPALLLPNTRNCLEKTLRRNGDVQLAHTSHSCKFKFNPQHGKVAAAADPKLLGLLPTVYSIILEAKL